MYFDPENVVVKLCAQGMELEGQGKNAEASALFQLAWENAGTFLEQFTAAHYVARHQQTVADKLKWDQIALMAALKTDDPSVQEALPSLYLNIAKCYEDLGENEHAQYNYERASLQAAKLPNDGYSNMIRNGIQNGLERLKNK